ncbi:hypothetical protein GCM10009690_21610 [Brevibacterium permense]|uniref:Uncharacterized protein n=1 Tax=Brevibacterium permense TaxID=234834 RepID=A0ABN2AFW6_9MICO
MEGCSDLLPDAEPFDTVSDLDDLTAELVAEHCGDFDRDAQPLLIALPSVPVTSADPGGLDPEHDILWPRTWVSDIFHAEWSADFSNYCCTHLQLHRRLLSAAASGPQLLRTCIDAAAGYDPIQETPI